MSEARCEADQGRNRGEESQRSGLKTFEGMEGGKETKLTVTVIPSVLGLRYSAETETKHERATAREEKSILRE